MADTYQQNYLESLRKELVDLVEAKLTPVALKYQYSDVSLESNIKWRPMVLVLGNYSSGKSTLINEFLGLDVQKMGQAPTDDSFTVITYPDGEADEQGPLRVIDERDGGVLLNDRQYPFELLKKHGSRFSAHFRLKRVNAPILKNLAIVDTPGMLDSISERDRGYDYQQVVGDLAQLADLILVMFDPHKAGTVQEAYHSLRKTLPQRTFEDRVVFVLNRVDECGSLVDLLRVYGTLCWNLSQMTGRKDIPRILLTYSQTYGHRREKPGEEFLHLLENQRSELKETVEEAPRHRLDHLATFVELHSERLGHFLEALLSLTKSLRMFRMKWNFFGLLLSLLAGAALGLYGFFVQPFGPVAEEVAVGAGFAIGIVIAILWFALITRTLTKIHRKKKLMQIDKLTSLASQSRHDSWQAIRDRLLAYLNETDHLPSVANVKREFTAVKSVYKKSSEEVRTAINESRGIKTVGLLGERQDQ